MVSRFPHDNVQTFIELNILRLDNFDLQFYCIKITTQDHGCFTLVDLNLQVYFFDNLDPPQK